MTRIFIECTQGIGDLIYIRPFVRNLVKEPNTEVYLNPVIPEIFLDIPGLRFIDPGPPKYRTQLKSYQASNVKFESDIPSEFDRTISWGYGKSDLRKHGIVAHLERSFGFKPSSSITFDLPYYFNSDLPILKTNKKIAIIRQPTIRKEWICSSRNPDPNYINWCSRILKDAGYYTVSIADCEENEEWIEGEIEPSIDLNLHRGEYGILGILNLLQQADIVVGGSGFIIPAAISAHTDLFVIFGGRGEYDNPRTVFDPRMNLKKIGWALPDNFCRCDQMSHECDKTISNLDDKFMNFLRQIQS